MNVVNVAHAAHEAVQAILLAGASSVRIQASVGVRQHPEHGWIELSTNAPPRPQYYDGQYNEDGIYQPDPEFPLGDE